MATKCLFLEEIQSDWGQKGKKEGFANITARLPKVKGIDEKRGWIMGC
jgi:hypothetical protein